MRVGYVAVQAQGRDGWGRYSAELVRAVRATGIEPVLVLARADLDPGLQGVEVHAVLPPPFPGRLERVRSLLLSRQLRRAFDGCQVVHCLVEPYAPLVVRSLPTHVPLVLTAHGSWAVQPLRSAARRWLFEHALRRVDLLVFQSAYTRQRMAERTRLPNHIVLSGGVDPAVFATPAAVAPPDWAARARIVLSVGAVKPRKGYATALEAVGQVMPRVPDLHYVVVGEGPSSAYAAQLQNRAEALGLGGRVHWLGSVPSPELVAWLQRAEVFLLLPVEIEGGFEGLGLVYLEAAAAGLPCIGTLDCGAEEAMVDGETGLLVPQADAGAAAEALIRLLSDGRLRKRMGEAGRQRAEQFTWRQLAEKMSAAYVRLLQEERLAATE